MRLRDIQRNYDMIFSLGDRCLPAYQLRAYHLKPYAGIIDWMLSPDLSQLLRLLQNRFQDFMEQENMVFEEYNTQIAEHLILRDTKYNIRTVHDFPITINTPENWPTYPTFKKHLQRRIRRFFNKLETCQTILFIRVGGTYKEAQLLEEILSKQVKGQFRVLLLQPINEYTILEYNWNLQHTCSLGIPMTTDTKIWDAILHNITCNDKKDSAVDTIF